MREIRGWEPLAFLLLWWIAGMALHGWSDHYKHVIRMENMEERRGEMRGDTKIDRTIYRYLPEEGRIVRVRP